MSEAGKKVIVFGPAGVGKTSTVLTSFFGYPFEAVEKLQPTKGISIESVKFRGLVKISVWDCAGQEKYMSSHFSDLGRMRIFSEIDVAVFVMDASRDDTLDAKFVDKFMEVVLDFNPDIEKVYIFINKMDIAPSDINDKVMKLTNDIISKWKNGIVEIINCSVKLGTTRRQFIQVLDSILRKDKELVEKQKFFSECLLDFEDVVKGKFVLFHTPSMLMTASTYSPEDVSWIGEEEFIVNEKIDIRKANESMVEDIFIQKNTDETLILMRVNALSSLLVIINEEVQDPVDIANKLMNHDTFRDLDQILYAR